MAALKCSPQRQHPKDNAAKSGGWYRDTCTRLITEADSTPTQPNLYNHAVTYDGDSKEGRQTGVLNPPTGLTGYVYDAEGRRIEKVPMEGWNTPNPQSVIQDEYLLGLNGEQVTVLDGRGNWQWTI